MSELKVFQGQLGIHNHDLCLAPWTLNTHERVDVLLRLFHVSLYTPLPRFNALNHDKHTLTPS